MLRVLASININWYLNGGIEMKYFSYCPEDGFQLHGTKEAAEQAANDSLDFLRDNAEEGWHDEVDQVCFGEVNQIATVKNEKSAEEAKQEGIYMASSIDYYCEYELKDVTPE